MYSKSFRTNEIPNVNQPLVYGWKRNHKFLYIGKSFKGIQRIIKNHPIITPKSIQGKDKIVIWFCSEEDDVDELEKKLIYQYLPTFNIIHTYRRRKSPVFDENGNQICLECNKIFEKKSNKIFCDSRCRRNYWNKIYNSEKTETRKIIEMIEENVPEE